MELGLTLYPNESRGRTVIKTLTLNVLYVSGSAETNQVPTVRVDRQ